MHSLQILDLSVNGESIVEYLTLFLNPDNGFNTSGDLEQVVTKVLDASAEARLIF